MIKKINHSNEIKTSSILSAGEWGGGSVKGALDRTAGLG